MLRLAPLRLASTALPLLLAVVLAGCNGTGVSDPCRRTLRHYEGLSHPAATYACFKDAALAGCERLAWDCLSRGARQQVSFRELSLALHSSEMAPWLERLARSRLVQVQYLDRSYTRARLLVAEQGEQRAFPVVREGDTWRLDALEASKEGLPSEAAPPQ